MLQPYIESATALSDYMTNSATALLFSVPILYQQILCYCVSVLALTIFSKCILTNLDSFFIVSLISMVISYNSVFFAVAHGDYFFPKKFEFVSLCSFICLQAVYQLSGPVCKNTWSGCPSYSASHLHFTLYD